MDTVITLVTLIGAGYGVFRGLKWMMKAGTAQASRNAPLSPSDLRVLEESAARLMEDLRAVTDECVARIERACTEAQVRIEAIEGASVAGAQFASTDVSSTQTVGNRTIPATPALVCDLTAPPATAAREFGMTTGEVELLRGLRAIEAGR